ncbi:MAG: transglutaminase family protein [Thermoguttaceae bacterium]|nr:transglutaminase family protein [Thermoguttaceae bacterium]
MSLRRRQGLRALALAVVAAAFLTAFASTGSAQISFGKMRDASEKRAEAPKTEDEEDEAFEVDPNERATTKTKPAASANRESEIANQSEDGDEPLPAPGKRTRKTTTRNAKSEEGNAENAAPANGKRGPVFGKAITHKYRAGMIFRAAANGACANVVGTAPVPMDFPEQKVRTLEEEFPRQAKVDYRDVKEGGARQLVFKMRELKAGQGVQATALYEVVRYPMSPPTEPEIYEIPKKVPNEIRRYLKAGPYIESGSKAVRSLAKQALADADGAWEKVDAIFKYVRENVQYKEILVEKPMRGALAAIKAREGDCEDQCALFIAMCRASDIPARLVRVPGHCWAEFYLVDDEKNGYWFPAQVAGTEPLGSLQDARVILQKGDSFHLPETPKEESLYVKELFMGNVKDGGGDPEHQFIQETDPN